jgi:uncharacterized protein (TIGR00290 family)
VSRKKVWLAWSSGKDSAWALHLLRGTDGIQVTALHTTVTEPYARVSMHAVRVSLLEAQADSAGLPLHKVLIPAPCTNEVYEAAMAEALGEARGQGVSAIAFGDIFLADLRDYRERQLARVNMEALFPLWHRDSHALAAEMMRAGLRAYVTCLDPRKLPVDLIGAAFDEAFLARLPAGIDPLGENGEFHTFAWDGPMFRNPIPVTLGESVLREGFLFQDLLPADTPAPAGP